MNQRIVAGLAMGVALTSLSAGCATGSGSIDAQAAAKHLMRLDDEWSAAGSRRDADAVAAFYAEDAIAYPPGEPLVKGRSDAKKVWATYFADPSFSISWASDDARVADSGDIGYTAGHYECSYSGENGQKVLEKGKFLCVWRRQADGSWKAIRDMWNADSR